MLKQAAKANVEQVSLRQYFRVYIKIDLIFFQLVISEEDLEPLGEQYKQALRDLKKIVENEEKLQLKKEISAKGKKGFKRKRKGSVGSVVSNANKDS